MKKTTLVLFAMTAFIAIMVIACAGRPQPAPQRVAVEPDWVLAMMNNQAADMFLGTGTGTFETAHAARSSAQARARAALALQMNSLIRNRIIDYTGASEAEPGMLQFFEDTSRILTQAHLAGIQFTTQTYRLGPRSYEGWSVATFASADAIRAMANAIIQAEEALATHHRAAMRAVASMDDDFARHIENRDAPITLGME